MTIDTWEESWHIFKGDQRNSKSITESHKSGTLDGGKNVQAACEESEGGREGGREGRREGGREGRRDGGREGEKEGRREGGEIERQRQNVTKAGSVKK